MIGGAAADSAAHRLGRGTRVSARNPPAPRSAAKPIATVRKRPTCSGGDGCAAGRTCLLRRAAAGSSRRAVPPPANRRRQSHRRARLSR